MKEEKIVCSAIRVAGIGRWDGLYLGLRHNDCFAEMKRFRDLVTNDDAVRVIMLRFSTQGFLTTKNRFVDREEAMQIAKSANQLIGNHGDKNKLYSEDIY